MYLQVKRVPLSFSEDPDFPAVSTKPAPFPVDTFASCVPRVSESLVSSHISVTCCLGPFYDHECGSMMLLAQFCWACVPPSVEHSRLPCEWRSPRAFPVHYSEVKPMAIRTVPEPLHFHSGSHPNQSTHLTVDLIVFVTCELLHKFTTGNYMTLWDGPNFQVGDWKNSSGPGSPNSDSLHTFLIKNFYGDNYYWHFEPDNSLLIESGCLVHCRVCSTSLASTR